MGRRIPPPIEFRPFDLAPQGDDEDDTAEATGPREHPQTRAGTPERQAALLAAFWQRYGGKAPANQRLQVGQMVRIDPGLADFCPFLYPVPDYPAVILSFVTDTEAMNDGGSSVFDCDVEIAVLAKCEDEDCTRPQHLITKRINGRFLDPWQRPS